MKFKAAILTEIGKPLVVSEIETTELKVGQVLIKILMSGLCGAQLQELAGLKGNSKFVPHLLGHEGCGIVEEIQLNNYLLIFITLVNNVFNLPRHLTFLT